MPAAGTRAATEILDALSASYGDARGKNLSVVYLDSSNGAISISSRFIGFNATLTSAGVRCDVVLLSANLTLTADIDAQHALSGEFTRYFLRSGSTGASRCKYDGIQANAHTPLPLCTPIPGTPHFAFILAFNAADGWRPGACTATYFLAWLRLPLQGRDPSPSWTL
eukprot:7380784-Prymnesium_polylepis.9